MLSHALYSYRRDPQPGDCLRIRPDERQVPAQRGIEKVPHRVFDRTPHAHARHRDESAYTRTFDLSGLPEYVPEGHPTGTLRICGNNYIGDSPLGGWWKEAFEKVQPGIKIDYNLQTAAVAISCLAQGLADIGITHEPSFYDYLTYQRLRGRPPTGIDILTGSYDVVGWQNNIVIVVNKANPLSHISLPQLDGVFGSERAGGWVGQIWHPEFARGPEKDIRTWSQLGAKGPFAAKAIHTYGYSLRYATALEFSDKVLHSSDKWNGNLLGFGNYEKPDGKTYLEADQIVDHVRDDPSAIAYVRFHPNFPTDLRFSSLAQPVRARSFRTAWTRSSITAIRYGVANLSGLM